ncbi:FMN-binding protein [Marinobacter sp. SS8-8]|uniref:FMN-binding protein n=1 Tax=Marinobacter sp. SS8-8 TaxID=3050452 RepID=UPI000C3701B6|nr:FMN-binding protein [Marinobacter sp. SS8-8]MAZ06454.1 FMN-binding protein [Halomonas sp.]|tara:strand:- start:8163 stop:8693 length:531 start_codon:yes stop_codon:yes gene_type:complete
MSYPLRLVHLLLLVTFLPVPIHALAGEVYKEPQAFLRESFVGDIPEPAALWVVGEKKEVAGDILGHPPAALRERYWKQGSRIAWILEEVGKARPITVGILVEENTILKLDVLVYRETRGWEVRYPVFTNQFKGAELEGGKTLNQPIDGITGATLSVHALTKLARLALYFSQLVDGP